MSITGIIGLVGVLVNDSLVLLHTLNEERRERGTFLSVFEVASVARRRFRPILITSVTTAVGLLPTAYGILGENSYISPMVMSMAWGVVFGGLVSLVLLPVLYMVEQDIRMKLSRHEEIADQV
jgi:multidrug efflux pump subunit AcrB